jgi:predicted ATP-grasp superfamily ATP-dependent carboligase
MKPPAIVLGGGSVNGLGVARTLGVLGIPVYCLTSNVRELTCFSKYCTGYAIVPEIERKVETLRKCLQQLRTVIGQPGVLFATGDTVLLTVAQLQGALDGYVSSLPTRELIETMVIKSKFYASVRRWGIPHPQTWSPDASFWSHVAETLPFPLFLRPVQSLPFFATFGKKGFIASSLQAVRAYLRMAEHAGHTLILQELIPGPSTNVYAIRGFLDKQSRPIVLVATKRVRGVGMFPPNAMMKSVPWAWVAEFAEDILTYLQRISYTGLFMAEFKRDPRDGTFKLLEINARSGGANDLVRACGVSHVQAAYREALGETLEPTLNYQSDVYHIKPDLDLYQNLWKVLHGQPLTLTVRPYLMKKHWRSFSTDDPVPFIRDMFTPRLHRLRAAVSRVKTKLAPRPTRAYT